MIMGKKHKYKGSVSMETLLNAINNRPISELLKIGRRVCGTDYAISQYNKKNTPFYHKPDRVRHALRRCVSIGAFDHCQQIIDFLGLEDENDA